MCAYIHVKNSQVYFFSQNEGGTQHLAFIWFCRWSWRWWMTSCFTRCVTSCMKSPLSFPSSTTIVTLLKRIAPQVCWHTESSFVSIRFKRPMDLSLFRRCWYILKKQEPHPPWTFCHPRRHDFSRAVYPSHTVVSTLSSSWSSRRDHVIIVLVVVVVDSWDPPPPFSLERTRKTHPSADHHTITGNERLLLFFAGKILKVNMSRLLLCEATSRIMLTGFKILGIRTLDRMWTKSYIWRIAGFLNKTCSPLQGVGTDFCCVPSSFERVPGKCFKNRIRKQSVHLTRTRETKSTGLQGSNCQESWRLCCPRGAVTTSQEEKLVRTDLLIVKNPTIEKNGPFLGCT